MPAFQDPVTHLTKQLEQMSPKLADAARYVLAHPEDAALMTLRDLADKADVHASTMNRLGQELGYGGFGGMKQAFQQWLRAHRAGFTNRARTLQQVEANGEDNTALLARLFDDQHANLEIARRANDPDLLTTAANLISEADRVFILGLRSVHAIAWSFHYGYQMFRKNSHLVTGHAAGIASGLLHFSEKDLLLVTGVSPFTRETVAGTEFARAQGGTIVALSDSDDSPLARNADVHLRMGAVGPSLFPPVAAGVAVAEALLAILIAKGGQGVVEAMTHREAQLSRFNAYWWPDDGSVGSE